MITDYHRKTKHFSLVKFIQQYMWNEWAVDHFGYDLT